MNVVHSYPVGDLIEHDTEGFDACICGPDVELVSATDDAWHVVHHSLDGREQQEAEAA